MTVIHPCDDISTEELTAQLIHLEGPSYMRTARNKTPRVYDESNVANLKIGSGSVIREGPDVAIIACGVMVDQAVIAAETLSQDGIECTVVDMHTIKPLDEGLIGTLVDSCGCFVSAEDHAIIGGLGSAVSEWLATNHPAPMEMVGVRDRFGESGSTSELMAMMGLSSEEICLAARKAIHRKT